jgi:hypothetical protein
VNPYPLSGGVRVYYLKERSTPWIADYLWLRTKKRPEVLWTVEQMDSLEKAGVVSAKTTLQRITYRIELPAKDYAEAMDQGVSLRPPTPPEAVIVAVRKFDGEVK